MNSYSYSFKTFHNRVPFLQREKAAYVILRRVGLSYNTISEAFGRSVSVVYNAVKNVVRAYHGLSGYWIKHRQLRYDLRKLPHKTRMRMASFRRAKMFKLLSAWINWICGEEGEPP